VGTDALNYHDWGRRLIAAGKIPAAPCVTIEAGESSGAKSKESQSAP
jgi:hypothetical protein